MVERFELEGTVEVFNLLNHENYNSFVLSEVARNFPQALTHATLLQAARTEAQLATSARGEAS